jgi:hypothetical protein
MLCLAMTTTPIIVADKGSNNTLIPMTFAQTSGNATLLLNKIQEWISHKDTVKILFAYQPERPIIDTFTKLEFRVINLTSNENLKDFDARVVVTNGQRLFKFENITVPDGYFSVEYIFPDGLDKNRQGNIHSSLSIFQCFRSSSNTAQHSESISYFSWK